MLNTKSFLAVDFGAGSLKAAEFEVNEAGGLRLKQYAIEPLGQEGAQETTREATILKALQKIISEKAIRSRMVNVCAPGFHVFSKFVKLPPVETSKVTQIIQYEAQQNVPFPLEQVVWDYQILGQTSGGELEVLLVAIKKEVVEGLFRVAENQGMKLQLCDVSPAALCNAFRYNYGDLEDCTMLLDIGAKTSNLLFFEKGKVYSRSISIGANAITQDLANETKLSWADAERVKVEEGFVSLGGAYEEPENPRQAAVSKIARQFMTRLHIQVNQTMQFYRGQQGGSAPMRVFLCGGASVMPYTAQFFAEKLNVPVEYFNPLRNVQIDPGINLEELARVAHSMGEVVGLGLRNLAHCPIELNLMPESTVKWQNFNEKKPYLIASVSTLAIGVLAVGWLFAKLAAVRQAELESQVKPRLTPLKSKEAQFKRAYGDLKKLQADAGQLTLWMEGRFYWADVLAELRQSLIRVEAGTKTKFGAETGVWVESVTTMATSAGGAPTEVVRGVVPMANRAPMSLPPGAPPGMTAEMLDGSQDGAPAPAPPPEPAGGDSEAGPGTALILTFRAISLSNVAPQANTETAFAVLNDIKESPLVDKDATQFSGNISADEPPGTFTFSIVVRLKRPLKM